MARLNNAARGLTSASVARSAKNFTSWHILRMVARSKWAYPPGWDSHRREAHDGVQHSSAPRKARVQPGRMPEYILQHRSNGKILAVGDHIQTFRGERGRLKFLLPPHRPGSSGKVEIQIHGAFHTDLVYPSVIDAAFVLKHGEDAPPPSEWAKIPTPIREDRGKPTPPTPRPHTSEE